jgi:Fis family transcriptional regulator
MLIRQSSAETVHVDDPEPGLARAVQRAVDRYINAMDDQPVRDLYEMVLSEIEAPLLDYVLRYTDNNQSRSATILGLNRGTLRKKLKKYNLL